MASPPKPWERAGAGATAASPTTTASSPSIATSPTASTTATAPPLPDRPASLSSTVNQNAAAYSRMNTSPYSSYGGAYSSPYSSMGSPYSRFGGYGGGYGGGMYGGGMYGGGMYGGGMYGGMGGMPGGPNDPNSLTNSFSNSTAATFQMLEGIVATFGGFAQMLESTYMATHSSFFAMVSVAEQFSHLRDTLGSILGIFTLMRWIRTLLAKITGRPPPADATALTPAAFARFEGRASGAADGSGATPRASRKPLLFFIAAAFGLPYLMSKLIKSLAASHEEEQQRLQQQALQQQQPIDPSKLEFCRLLYDFLPQPNTGVELEARKGDLVAVLTKNDPTGNPSDWWQCRSRDGRQGYLPSTYLELLKRPTQDVKQIKSADDTSRTSSLTSAAAEGQKQIESEGKKEYTTVEGMQRSQFYS
ncbi:hypothetical protein V2G26_011691 [Clonostachys chloroleuca]|uniref:Peroxisomal membrane protein PEX13 n=1 Tax=Clonostachys chloroleuca TaxID=1926264 RepID=A0AA35LVA8_9HYPO|nr:unnamed protein product [Clonostachys chloroleuca]